MPPEETTGVEEQGTEEIEQTQETEQPEADDSQALRDEITALKNQQENMAQLMTVFATGGGGGYSSNVTADPDPVEVNPELDDEQRRLAEHLEKKFSKQIAEKEKVWAQAFTSNRQQNQSYIAGQERRQMINRLNSLGKPDVMKDVDEYIKANNVAPEYLAVPGGYEVIAQTVIGRRVMDEMSRRSASPVSGGRAPVSSPSEEVNPDDLAYLQQLGIEMDAEELKLLSSNEKVTVVQFDEHNSKKVG